MKCGSADHVLDKLKQVLGDVASACSGDGKEQIAEKILKGITNTMSDRCIVQKKFNELLQEYRADVLPSVVGGWEDLTSEQQSKLTTMNNYFCGLHYIVGLADQAQECLKKWEEVHFEGKAFGATELPRVFDTTESRVIRMLRTTANAFEKHGNEQAGCMADFNVYMEETGIPVPLAELRGNRSYVCFYNGAGVYYLRETLLHFLRDIHGDTNLLLKAVKADLSVDELCAGARALGLLSKLVITPLWKALEDATLSIFDMSTRYTELYRKFVEWSEDASPLLDGTARPFAGATPNLLDVVTTRLLEPDESDAVTQEILQVLCAAYAAYSARLLADHLPGGKFHDPSDDVRQQSQSVASTNAVPRSERDFAQLDRMIREKPCARTVALEGMIMFTNNKTAVWLSAKSEEDRAAILASARQSAPAVQDLYKKRRQEIRDHRMKVLKDKEEEIAKKKARDTRQKQDLTGPRCPQVRRSLGFCY
eukprot:scpid58269/ scgid33823/ 